MLAQARISMDRQFREGAKDAIRLKLERSGDRLAGIFALPQLRVGGGEQTRYPIRLGTRLQIGSNGSSYRLK
jgi:hypothetical protein